MVSKIFLRFTGVLLIIISALTACTPKNILQTPTLTPVASPAETPSPIPVEAAENFAHFAKLMPNWPANLPETHQALVDGLLVYLRSLPGGLHSLTTPEAMAQLRAQLQPQLRSEQQLQVTDLDSDGWPELLVAMLPPASIIRQTDNGLKVEDLPAPRYWPPDAVWPTIEQVIDLTGDQRPEIIFTYNFPSASFLGQELLVTGQKDGEWVEWLRLPLNNWAGGGEWRLDNRFDPPALVTTCAAFGTFDAKLIAHPLQRNTYRWTGDHFAWDTLEQQEPANLRQSINIFEAGLRLGHFEAALNGYRYLAIEQPNLPDEPAGATSQDKPDWIAFAALRAGQIHALLGQPEGALALLSQAEEAGSTIGRLARLFRERYEVSGDPAAAWVALLTDTKIYEEAYNEQGNLVSFPGNPLGALYPGMALAAVLNSRSDIPNDDPEAMRAAWTEYDLTVSDILAADLDSDGQQEVVIIQPLSSSPDSTLAQTPVWLLDRGPEGWFAVFLGQYPDLVPLEPGGTTIKGPFLVPGTFYQAVQVGNSLVRGWHGYWVNHYQDTQSWLLDTDPTTLCPVIFRSALSPAAEIVPPEPLLAASTPAPTPLPTSMIKPPDTEVEPLVTADRLSFLGWSPDSEMLAYLEHTPEDLAAVQTHPFPPGTLKFLNARTGQICDSMIIFPEGDYNRFAQLSWLPNGWLLIKVNDQTLQGIPCGAFTPVTNSTSPDEVVSEPSLSPQVSHRASTVIRDSANSVLNLVTTITNVATGQVENVIEWRLDERLGDLGLGGEWLTEDIFLIYETLDQGPLLVKVGEGVSQVVLELFNLPGVPSILDSEGVSLRATGAVVAGTEAYHLLLSGVGLEANFPPVRLYHSETGEVEELAFRYLGWPPFSPDGRWLVLDARPNQDSYERYELWTRPVDPPNGEAHPLTDKISAPISWSPDWDTVAAESEGRIVIFSAPAGTHIGSWRGGDYNIFPQSWSPNGEFLAASGYLRHSRGEGLLIIPAPQ